MKVVKDALIILKGSLLDDLCSLIGENVTGWEEFVTIDDKSFAIEQTFVSKNGKNILTFGTDKMGLLHKDWSM